MLLRKGSLPKNTKAKERAIKLQIMHRMMKIKRTSHAFHNANSSAALATRQNNWKFITIQKQYFWFVVSWRKFIINPGKHRSVLFLSSCIPSGASAAEKRRKTTFCLFFTSIRLYLGSQTSASVRGSCFIILITYRFKPYHHNRSLSLCRV